MEKKRVSVQIDGRSYIVITSDEESYVKQVADEVARDMLKASRSAAQLDSRDCAILTALDYCDDKNRAVRRNKDLVDKADKIIKQSAELNRQCKEYKERLTDAINENTALSKRVRALEEQLRVLNRENEKLKKNSEAKRADSEKKFEKSVQDKKSEKLMGYVPMRQYSLFDDEQRGAGAADAPERKAQTNQSAKGKKASVKR